MDVGRLVAVSMESAERSTEVVQRWRLTNLPVAYGLTEDDAREWGLFISTAIKDGEPARFSEPGIFIIDSGGIVYWSSVASMPFGRPADILIGSSGKVVAVKYRTHGADQWSVDELLRIVASDSDAF